MFSLTKDFPNCNVSGKVYIISHWFLLSQRLLWPHLEGSCFWFLFSQLFFAASGGMFFLVPFKSAFIVVSSGGKLFWFLFSHFFFAASGGNLFLVPFKSASIDAASGGKLVFGSF